MPIAGGTSPSGPNEHVDEFWDKNFSALEDDELSASKDNKAHVPEDLAQTDTGSTHVQAADVHADALAKENTEIQEENIVKRKTPGAKNDPLENAADAFDTSVMAAVPDEDSNNAHHEDPVDPETESRDEMNDLETPKDDIGVALIGSSEDTLQNDASAGVAADALGETKTETEKLPPVEDEAALDQLDVGSIAAGKTTRIDSLVDYQGLQLNGFGKAAVSELVAENSHGESREVDNSIGSLELDEPDALSKDPHSSIDTEVPAAEVLQLGHQVKSLDLELQEKDSRLQQMASKNDSPQVNEDSPLAERLRELAEALQQTEKERDHAQAQLEGFLSKISSMKTVFQNYKETQRELEETRLELAEVRQEKEKEQQEKQQISDRLAEIERENLRISERQDGRETEKKQYLQIIDSLKHEALELNLECDRVSQLMATLRREFQSKEEALQDEKYTLENEVSRLNKKLSDSRIAYSELECVKEEALIENKNMVSSMEEAKDRLHEKETQLQKLQALATKSQDVLEAGVSELERLVEEKDRGMSDAHAKIERLEAELVLTKKVAEERASAIAKLEKETEKIKVLEEDVHSKQLIIGKLRHEAITLNEHLTKSISMLKQKLGDSNASVDRELVSNLFLKFLQIPRGDTKKFEVLLLIGGLLDWDDLKKILAGLRHSGKSDETRPQRLSIISLWTDFLDKESSKM